MPRRSNAAVWRNPRANQGIDSRPWPAVGAHVHSVVQLIGRLVLRCTRSLVNSCRCAIYARLSPAVYRVIKTPGACCSRAMRRRSFMSSAGWAPSQDAEDIDGDVFLQLIEDRGERLSQSRFADAAPAPQVAPRPREASVSRRQPARTCGTVCRDYALDGTGNHRAH